MNNDKEALVVIPYLAKEAQGCELELAVAGWHKHFKEPHKVVVVGDRDEHVDKLLICPDGETEGSITFIDCPQIEPVEGQYLPHLDMVHKFEVVSEAFPDKVGFIYACDDMYAVQDFMMVDITSVYKISDAELPEIDWQKERGWWRDIGKTREVCAAHDWATMNWVCHLPIYYDFRLLKQLYYMFDAHDISYVWENIFYNFMWSNAKRYDFMKDVEPVIVPEQGSKWKYAIKNSNPGINSTDDAHAIWITNANSGWSERLEKILREHYGEKL